jgi:hypothetical protein
MGGVFRHAVGKEADMTDEIPPRPVGPPSRVRKWEWQYGPQLTALENESVEEPEPAPEPEPAAPEVEIEPEAEEPPAEPESLAYQPPEEEE